MDEGHRESLLISRIAARDKRLGVERTSHGDVQKSAHLRRGDARDRDGNGGNYAQPSCTPGRAAVQTGRVPNRSGMTTVAFQGQGGGLPAAEWTLASVLKQAGYRTFFTGKWHLGEADYALPNAQGYDEMKYVGLYHLNAYTYATRRCRRARASTSKR